MWRTVLYTDVTYSLKWTVASHTDRAKNQYVYISATIGERLEVEVKDFASTDQIRAGEETKNSQLGHHHVWTPLTSLRQVVTSSAALWPLPGFIKPDSQPSIPTATSHILPGPLRQTWFDICMFMRSESHVGGTRITCKLLHIHMTFHASVSHLRAFDLISVSRTSRKLQESPMSHTFPVSSFLSLSGPSGSLLRSNATSTFIPSHWSKWIKRCSSKD